MTTRRDFIKQTGLYSAGVLLAPGLMIPKKKDAHVIVLGAGFSGLAAAMKLKRAGVNVTVLEARNR